MLGTSKITFQSQTTSRIKKILQKWNRLKTLCSSLLQVREKRPRKHANNNQCTQTLPKFRKYYFPRRFTCLHWHHPRYPFSSYLAGKILLCFRCSPCLLRLHQVRHPQLHRLRLRPENGQMYYYCRIRFTKFFATKSSFNR